MFTELRMKLTRINIAVMALLCFLLLGGTYLMMEAVIFNQSQQMLQLITSDAAATNSVSATANSTNSNHHTSLYFYLKLDSAGNIIEHSSDIPNNIDTKQLSVLAQHLSQEGPRGEIDLHDTAYSYLITPPSSPNAEQILAFVSVDRDKNILHFLLLTLTTLGIIYLIIAYFASRYLANRALQPIIQSWHRQQDFVADASHELRTPLAVIQTNLELVQGNGEETVASQKKWLSYIDFEVKRLTQLINDLLFLARADSNQHVLDLKEFSLTSALQMTVESFQPLATKQQVELTFSSPPNILMLGDENKLRQLLVILLDNALKHTPAQGKIFVHLQQQNGNTLIQVRDTGEGISPEHLPHLFDRFYRADKARSKQTGGSGLGLAIAEGIVKGHQGNIKVDSKLGQGTFFTITLPNSFV
ncbi:sensor histidine kinase [Desulfitobacterium sp.]|uniref:sensor histidine kinase n=1 Tax=Desulfitobacterium sp. TaxID=49981 RepID=UPI002CC18AFB|nr:ATP-binding protein [Desulfitobacterium sp.]HVJ47738.1 ATP-binding protein [Desulfitobacterium sp.]